MALLAGAFSAAGSDGFYRVQEIEGVWWWIAPNGGRFISKGVNHVSYTADHAPSLGYSPYERAVSKKYESKEAWGKASAARLKSWGFNTIGAWSSPEARTEGMAYTLILNIAYRSGGDWQSGRFPDVFSDRFRESAEKIAREECAPLKDDPNVLGYFTDNELRWGPDWRSPKSLLRTFWEFPADSPGKRRAYTYVRELYNESMEELNAAWGGAFESWEIVEALGSLDGVAGSDAFAKAESGFLRLVAEAYYRTTTEAIRRHDPNHAVIGCRHAGYAAPEVLESMRGYVDVVSFNHYGPHAPAESLRNLYEKTGAPAMLTEFSFKAMDSGLPNTRGAGEPVAAQRDRADGFERYVRGLMELPYVIGYHWFEHADEPAEGRFDGENSNYGVVNIADEPWAELTERMTRVNADAEAVHAASGGGE